MFSDALAENGSAKEVMKSDTLRHMARELTEMVKRMPKLDLTRRESVRADLRCKVRRLLAMYGYPPVLAEGGHPARPQTRPNSQQTPQPNMPPEIRPKFSRHRNI